MKKVLALAIAGAFAVPATAGAAPSEVKVTGGGKTAGGETIAFVAQGPNSSAEATNRAAKGQLQFNNHKTGEEALKVHGTVTCVATGMVDTDGDDTADAAGYEISGTIRDETGAVRYFNVKGTDGGEPAEGTDTVVFAETADYDECDLEPAEAYQNQPELATGNIKIHKTNPSLSKKQQRTDMRAAKRTANAAQFNAAAFATGLALTTLL